MAASPPLAALEVEVVAMPGEAGGEESDQHRPIQSDGRPPAAATATAPPIAPLVLPSTPTSSVAAGDAAVVGGGVYDTPPGSSTQVALEDLPDPLALAAVVWTALGGSEVDLKVLLAQINDQDDDGGVDARVVIPEAPPLCQGVMLVDVALETLLVSCGGSAAPCSEREATSRLPLMLASTPERLLGDSSLVVGGVRYRPLRADADSIYATRVSSASSGGFVCVRSARLLAVATWGGGHLVAPLIEAVEQVMAFCKASGL